MDPSSSQTYLKQPIENSNENKENSQTIGKSVTNVRQQKENALFKDSDLIHIEFIVDNIKYQLDPRYMLWSTELLKQDKIQDQNQFYPEIDQIKKKSHKSMDLKKLYESNKTQIEILNKELHDLELAKQKAQSRLSEVKTTKEQQLKIYKIERQKTENIKGCRERLEKLKKELGF